MKGPLNSISDYLGRGVWESSLGRLPLIQAVPMRLLRSAVLTANRLVVNQIPIRAQALTYVTVLSLVPLLAFAFSIAKGFGLYDKLVRDVVEPFLLRNFGASTPIPAIVDGVEEIVQPSQLRVAIDQVLGIVEGTDVKSLGLVGLVVLGFAAIRLLSQVEQALNRIWGVRRQRRILRRLTDYLAMLVIGPVLALGATALKASSQSNSAVEWVRNELHLGAVLDFIVVLGPLFTMWGVFTLLYLVMTATRVRFFSALLGGFVAALGWSLVQEFYVGAQLGVSNYSQVYATFAAIPLFLFWVYLSWMAVLVGAQFGNADQDQNAYRRQALARTVDQAWFETAVLAAVGRIAERFESGGSPLEIDKLVEELEIPRPQLLDGLERLEAAEVLTRSGPEGEPRFVLARAADRVHVSDLLIALRGEVPEQVAAGDHGPDRELVRAARGLEQVQRGASGDLDLRSLLQGATGTPSAENGTAPSNGKSPGPS